MSPAAHGEDLHTAAVEAPRPEQMDVCLGESCSLQRETQTGTGLSAKNCSPQRTTQEQFFLKDCNLCRGSSYLAAHGLHPVGEGREVSTGRSSRKELSWTNHNPRSHPLATGRVGSEVVQLGLGRRGGDQKGGFCFLFWFLFLTLELLFLIGNNFFLFPHIESGFPATVIAK